MAVLDGYGGRLETNPETPTGSPVIKGTTAHVDTVVSIVINGLAWQLVLRMHPGITKDDIRACLEYAADECNRVKGMVV